MRTENRTAVESSFAWEKTDYKKIKECMVSRYMAGMNRNKPKWGAEEGKEYYVLMVHAVCEEESVAHAYDGVPKR